MSRSARSCDADPAVVDTEAGAQAGDPASGAAAGRTVTTAPAEVATDGVLVLAVAHPAMPVTTDAPTTVSTTLRTATGVTITRPALAAEPKTPGSLLPVATALTSSNQPNSNQTDAAATHNMAVSPIPPTTADRSPNNMRSVADGLGSCDATAMRLATTAASCSRRRPLLTGPAGVGDLALPHGDSRFDVNDTKRSQTASNALSQGQRRPLDV